MGIIRAAWSDSKGSTGESSRCRNFSFLQFQPERAASSGFRVDSHPSAHPFGGLFHNGQPNARAFVLFADPLKHHEDLVLEVLGNSDAIVLDEKTNHRRAARCGGSG